MPTKTFTQAINVRLFDEVHHTRSQAVSGAILGHTNIAKAVAYDALDGMVRTLVNIQVYGGRPSYYYGQPSVKTGTANNGQPGYLNTLLTDPNMSVPPLPNGATPINYGVDINNYHIALPNDPLNPAGDIEYTVHATLSSAHDAGLLTWNKVALEVNGGAMTYSTTSTHLIIYRNGVNTGYSFTYTNPITAPVHYCDFLQWYQYRDTSSNDPLEILTGYSTILRTFTYRESTNAIPQLHISTLNPIEDEIMPVIPIREDKQYVTDDVANPLKAVSVEKALSFFPISLDSMVEQVKDNPDEGSIDDLYITFGFDITETEPWAIHGMMENIKILNAHVVSPKGANDEFNSFEMIQGDFIYTMYYSNITTNTVPRFLIGQHSVTVGNIVITETDNGFGGTFTNITYDITFVRNHPTDISLSEIIVMKNLKAVVEIRTAGTRGSDDYKFRVTEFTGKDVLEGTKRGLFIPLFRSGIHKVPVEYRTEAATGSLMMQVSAIQVIHLDWWETGIFRGILFIGALILAAPSGGKSLAAAAAIGGTTAVAVLVFKFVLIQIVISATIKYLIENFGVRGKILSLLILVGNPFGVTSSVTALSGQIAQLIMSIARIETIEINKQLADIEQQEEIFAAEYDVRIEQLEELQSLLDDLEGVPVNLLAIDLRSKPNTTIGESPDQFYNRSTTVFDLPEYDKFFIEEFHTKGTELPIADSYNNTFEGFGEV